MNDPSASGPNEPPRSRTVSRMRFVAPPGISIRPSAERKTIGRYEVIKTLGKGAMGIVYKARDPLLDRIVAVKTIGSPRGVGRRVRNAYLERFEREAKAAAKMQHPAIVTIFDVGLDNGAPFMVLEYLPGETLADRLDRVRMPLGKAVPIALELASALGFAHKVRIVHRDMKPANVLHAGEDRWKLADFGIARLPDSDLTQVGIFMGTPGYSPPEAIREGRYTPQADVFAWGAVLYELLSGYIPYEGPDTRTTNGFVLAAKAVPPTAHDRSIPAPLVEVTMRALSPSTKQRYKDGCEAEEALRAAWQKCLTSNLVMPASLAGDEVPHERVGAEMHSTSQIATRPEEPPSVTEERGSDNQETRIERPRPPARAADRGRGKQHQPILVIESGSDAVSDNDPTRLMIRSIDVDDADTRPEEAIQGEVGERVASTQNDPDAADKAKAAARKRSQSPARAREATAETPPASKSKKKQKKDKKAKKAKKADKDKRADKADKRPATRPRVALGFWIALVLAVLVAGAGAAAFYLYDYDLIGAIKFW